MSAQTFTPGSAPIAGYEAKNYLRIVTASQTNSSVFTFPSQNIEDVRTFAGQTVTISFFAKAGSGTPKVAVELDQYFGSGGSPSAGVTTYAGQVTLSTSWARYSVTVAVPSISGKTLGTNPDSLLGLNLWVSAGSNFNARTGTLGLQNGTFEFWGVQVEAGSVATAFQTATGTLQGELAACQRYYYRRTPTGAGSNLGTGFADTTTAAVWVIPFPTTMRTAPTALEQSGTASDYTVRYQGLASAICSAVPVFASATIDAANINATVASGLTAGDGILGRAANSSAYLAWSAEL